MDVFYDPELPVTHRQAWTQIEQLRDSLPVRLITARRQVREAVELLRAHGLTEALDSPPVVLLEVADELQATAERVCDELSTTTPTALSAPLTPDTCQVAAWRRDRGMA